MESLNGENISPENAILSPNGFPELALIRFRIRKSFNHRVFWQEK